MAEGCGPPSKKAKGTAPLLYIEAVSENTTFGTETERVLSKLVESERKKHGDYTLV